MTRFIDNLADVAAGYDAIVLDQWGVLHDGTTPYPDAIAALEALNAAGTRLAVLSNSGKRAAPNADRIAAMGFRPTMFDCVMTSGEALWQDVRAAHVPQTRFFAIERAPGDAAAWADGLDIDLVDSPQAADAILLMGLPDGQDTAPFRSVLAHARSTGIPVYCSNPDRASPRDHGKTVVSPGALAHAHRDAGGEVVFYGKPHRPVFTALEQILGTQSLLMVGDSLDHDIAGGHGAGWATALIRGGLYASDFAQAEAGPVLSRLVTETGAPPPTYSLDYLR